MVVWTARPWIPARGYHPLDLDSEPPTGQRPVGGPKGPGPARGEAAGGP
jgi:hypothetical protein